MYYASVSSLMPYKGNDKTARKRINSMNQEWKTLTEDTCIENIHFAKGSPYKAFETTNFGWVVFHPDARCTNGTIPFKRIFKF